MSEYESAALERAATDGSIDLEKRDARALTEYLTVLPDAPGMYRVVSQSGEEYTVDGETGACTCPDAEYRDPDGGCKHVRRVRFETGERAIPAWIDPDVVPEDFAAHVNATPVLAVTDGGLSAVDHEKDTEGDESERPDDCDCAPCMGDLPCWPCFRDGRKDLPER